MHFKVCDTRFCVAYLVKYAAGEDERFLARLRQKTPSSASVTLEDEQIRKRSKKSARGHGYTISTTEMATHVTGLSIVASTVSPVHVNTSPPEERYVTLKPSTSSAEPGPVYGPQRMLPGEQDGTRCGFDPNGRPTCPQREPSSGQRRAYMYAQLARTTPDKVTPPLTNLTTPTNFYYCLCPSLLNISYYTGNVVLPTPSGTVALAN